MIEIVLFIIFLCVAAFLSGCLAYRDHRKRESKVKSISDKCDEIIIVCDQIIKSISEKPESTFIHNNKDRLKRLSKRLDEVGR